jgi:uncharacterized protein (TIGR03086 family)
MNITAAELHREALHDALANLKSISNLDQPSNAKDWTIRDVAAHLIWGTNVYRRARDGEPFDPTTASDRREPLDQDPITIFERAITALGNISQDLGNREVAFPQGFVPLETAVRIRIFDVAIHTWDIVATTNTDWMPSPAVAQIVADVADERLSNGTLIPAHFDPPRDNWSKTKHPFKRALIISGRTVQP